MYFEKYPKEKEVIIKEIKDLKITKYKLYSPKGIDIWLAEKEDKIRKIKIEYVENNEEIEKEVKKEIIKALRKKCESLKANNKYILDIYEKIELNTEKLNVQLGETCDIDVSNANFKSLKNVSMIMNGSLTINASKITELEEVPIYVDGNYKINHNQIKEINKCPIHVSKEYDISLNGIEKINKMPIYIGKDINVNNNKLKEIPSKLQNIVNGNLDISDNKIKNLKNSPKKIRGSFFGQNNELTNIEDGPEIVSNIYNIGNNNITNLKGLPKYLMSISISDNPIESLEGSPEIVKENYFANNTRIEDLKGIGKQVGNIYVSNKNDTKISMEYLPQMFNLVVKRENKVKYELEEKEAREEGQKDRTKKLYKEISEEVYDNQVGVIKKINKVKI